jgi:deazaflavin-dependent oxidoreductase (nitroreductase family)
MMAEQQVVDSPRGWVNRHIQSYVDSGGTKGHLWRGVPTLLLTTTGRKSGLRRRTALIYGQDGDAYVVVASNGGTVEHPLWYSNLVADPNVEVQVGEDVFKGVARTADAEERARLWPMMADIWPDYRNYQKKTAREIPVVLLERA